TSVELNAPPAGGTFPCGSGSNPNAVIRMAWDEPTDVTNYQRVIVAYVVKTVGTEQQLHRIRCAGPVAGPWVQSADLVIVHNVVSVDPPTLTPNTGIPQTVQMTVTIKAPTNTGSPLVVNLFGQRRQT